MALIRLLVMRTADCTMTHPQATYAYRCSKCKEPVVIYPSGQSVLAKHGDAIEIVCVICDDGEHRKMVLLLPRSASREQRESIDFTKKKQ